MRNAVYCLAAVVLALDAAAIATNRQGELLTAHLPEMDAAPPAVSQEIVTGVCTFGDCPVAMSETLPATEPPTAPETETQTEPETFQSLSITFQENCKVDGVTEDAYYSPSYFCVMGELFWGGWRWTWYPESVLPGTGLHIPGRHNDAEGYIRDVDGYLCIASDDLAHGTVIETPFGSLGKVYDEVSDDGSGSGTLDVYVGW